MGPAIRQISSVNSLLTVAFVWGLISMTTSIIGSPSLSQANQTQISKNSPKAKIKRSRKRKVKQKKSDRLNSSPDSHREEQTTDQKSVDQWVYAMGLRGGLISTPLPSLGLALSSRLVPRWGLNLSWENGSVEPDPEAFLGQDSDSAWTVSSLALSATRLALTGRWYFLNDSWFGFGFYQKNIVVTIDFVFSSSTDGAFNVVGSLLSKGFILQWGSLWVFKERILLEVIWIGLDWPLWSDILFEGQNETLSVAINDEFLARQDQTKNLINGIRNYPLPSVMVLQLNVIF